MKKFFLTAVFVLLASTCTSVTLAQTSTDSSRPPRLGRVGLELDKTASRAAAKGIDRLLYRPTNIKEKVASRTAQLKERLKTFRDQKKAQIVERVNDRIANINEVRTNNMLKHLNKMSGILAKLENRVNDITDKDTTAAKTAINNAKAKVASAEAAVNTQAQKDYPIEATSEGTIKNNVVDARLALQRDLKALHELVKEARKAVGHAIQVVAETLGGVKHGQQ